MNDFKFDLGSRVKDRVTGFQGIVIGRTQWVNGCKQYAIKSETLKDGMPQDAAHIDEEQILLVDEGLNADTPITQRATGGPALERMPRSSRPA